jgi:hypothetical protein
MAPIMATAFPVTERISPGLIEPPSCTSTTIFAEVRTIAAGAVATVVAGPIKESTPVIICPVVLTTFIDVGWLYIELALSVVVTSATPISIVVAINHP